MLQRNKPILQYARLAFLGGFTLIVVATAFSFFSTDPVVTMILVLVGLVLVTVALTTALFHTTKTTNKLAVTNAAPDRLLDNTGLVEILMYFFFVK